KAAHAGQEIHARVVLTIADLGGIGCRRQVDRFAVAEPARVSGIYEMVVAVVGFDHRALERTDIDCEAAKSALVVAVIHPRVALAEQAIEAVTDDAVAVELAAEVQVRGADAVA